MTMATLDEVNEALSAQATAGIDGLDHVAMIGDAIGRDTFGVLEHDADYHRAFKGGSSGLALQEIDFTCQLLVVRNDTPTTSARLSQYLSTTGDRSIVAKIVADRTLGGLIKTLDVTGFRGSGRRYEVAGVWYPGAVIDVKVWLL